MPVYEIAGITVEYDCKFDLLKSRSRKYLASECAVPELSLNVTDEYLESRRIRFPEASDETLEYMGIGTAFYKSLLNYGGMMLHASAVALDGRAYLFSAPSGVGKSTHTARWLELFGSRALIVNDDKPAIKKTDGVYYAYGTPFSGKYDLSFNGGFPVQGICFLERSQENSIRRLTPGEAIAPLFDQTVRPAESENMDLLCERADDILNTLAFYHLRCRVDDDAVKTAYEAMKDFGV